MPHQAASVPASSGRAASTDSSWKQAPKNHVRSSPAPSRTSGGLRLPVEACSAGHIRFTAVRITWERPRYEIGVQEFGQLLRAICPGDSARRNKLGIDIGETSVSKYLVRGRKPPSLGRRSDAEHLSGTRDSRPRARAHKGVFGSGSVFLAAEARRRLVDLRTGLNPRARLDTGGGLV